MNAKNEQNEKEEEEILDFNNPSYTFIPKGRHTYRQKGFYLVCKSCEITHATFIGPNKVMVGEADDGEPILEKRM